MISLQRLRYFVAVAEELHFTRAARRLYVDQGALSTAIRQLERDLGAPLFDRSSRRVELTALGASLMPDVVDLLRRADRLRNGVDLAARHGSADQALRIGLLSAPGPAFAPILHHLYLAAPNLQVVTKEVGISDVAADLANRRLDAVFMYLSPRSHLGYRTIPLWENGYGISVSRRHKLADATTLTIRDIIDEPFRPLEPGEDLAQYSAATLRDTRGFAAPTCTGWIPATTFHEIALQAASRSDMMVATNATVRACRSVESYGLTFVPVTDGPRSVTSLVIGNHSEKCVEPLVRAARAVATGISDLIPRTWPHPDITQPEAAPSDDLMSL